MRSLRSVDRRRLLHTSAGLATLPLAAGARYKPKR